MPKFSETALKIESGFIVGWTDATKFMSSWKATRNEFKLRPNFPNSPASSLIKKCTFFLMDQKDIEHFMILEKYCTHEKQKKTAAMKFVRSLTDSAEDYDKQIYIRAIPSSTFQGDVLSRIFCDDVLEVIPLLFSKQNTPMKGLKEKLESYRKKWKTEDHIYKTIEIGQFVRILTEFDCDKSLITIVEDFIYIMTKKDMQVTGSYMRTCSWDLKIVFDISQAVHVVFKELVHGVNWHDDCCNMHKNCLENTRKNIFKLLQLFANFGTGTHLTLDHVNAVIENSGNKCSFLYKPNEYRPHSILYRKPLTDTLETRDYREITSRYHLPAFKNFMTSEPYGPYPVWMVKLFVELGWMQEFFPINKKNGIKEILRNALLHEVPAEFGMEAQKFLDTAIGITFKKPESSGFSVGVQPSTVSPESKLLIFE